jgi:hypothetical protein
MTAHKIQGTRFLHIKVKWPGNLCRENQLKDGLQDQAHAVIIPIPQRSPIPFHGLRLLPTLQKLKFIEERDAVV